MSARTVPLAFILIGLVLAITTDRLAVTGLGAVLLAIGAGILVLHPEILED